MVIEQVITLGNLVVTCVVVIGAVASTIINTVIVSAKTTKFVTMTEMKFQAGEKKFVEHDKDIENLQSRCGTCPQKVKVEVLEKERSIMRERQIQLRAELPVKLDNIDKSISDLKTDISNLRNDLALSKKP